MPNWKTKTSQYHNMAELQLEGYTLGEKHQHFNKLVQEAITNNVTVKVEDFNSENSDVLNLLNIDIASRNKNLEYILKILTCNNMLYVSRAIKQSDWLINDKNYAHIVNPEYFQTNLFPQMCAKGIIKLVKHIRNVLKDQKRAEEFYYFEQNAKEAVKWLPCCSLEVILENITKHIQHVKSTLLRRLCEKSISVLEIYVNNLSRTQKKSKALQTTMFLLPSHTDKFLDIAENNGFPKFNKKATSILMKKTGNRIINNFIKYYAFIHIPTFISFLKPENIKDFLLKETRYFDENNIYHHRFNQLNRLLLFIWSMPQEIRFEFVKEVFIDKIHLSKENCVLSEEEKSKSLLYIIGSMHNQDYVWYQFAPIDIAFQKIQELIRSVAPTRGEVHFFEIALISTQNNLSYERKFIEFLRDNQKNTDTQVMERILQKLIWKNNFIKYDINTWNILDDIFKHIDIYNKLKNSEPVIIDAIILYKVIHGEKVSEIIENKFKFNSLLPYHKKISENEKATIFTYLYNLMLPKLTPCITTNEKEFQEIVNKLGQTLILLKDNNKELKNYPDIISIFKNLVRIKNEQSWNVNMESIFNIKKSWRKLFFEESLALSQKETVLLNALKHGPLLLEQNEKIVKNMLCNDKISMTNVLAKIKIYWTSSLASNMTRTYMEQLNDLGCHKATTRGLSILLPLKPLSELIHKYIPKEAKIDWAKIDEVELSIQKQFAKNMHISNPQPIPEIILKFAKGDYLQYALPSLFAIFYNLNGLDSQKYIPSLLDAPVSLQKHGIRLAVSTFKHEQLLSIFSNIWKNNKNASIRSVIFKTVYELLCKEKDSNKIKTTWKLIEIFIVNLTFEEDKAIYKLLFAVEKVPLEIRGQYYMKSYKLIHDLLKSGDQYENYKSKFYTHFTAYSKEIIEELHPDFVEEIVQEFIADEFTKKQPEAWGRGCVSNIISSYLLCSNDEPTQLEKYNKVLLPILNESLALWSTEDFIKRNLTSLLNTLRRDIKQYAIDMKKFMPHKMFSLIQEELNRSLEIRANYMLLTKWKLTVSFLKILNACNPIDDWNETCIKVSNEFGTVCIDYLREDCVRHFPRIYLLFIKALHSMLNDFVSDMSYWGILKVFISDKTFIQGYLAAITLMANIHMQGSEKEVEEKQRLFHELCKNICEHPSMEIKIHYHNQIKEIK